MNDFKPFYFFLAFIIFIFLFYDESHATNVSVYMVAEKTSESTLMLEVFVDVATEFLGSYDLVISFNKDLFQFQSISSGNTYGQLRPEPTNSLKDGLLNVNGIFTFFPKGLVSLLFIQFSGTSDCMNAPFDVYVFGLTNKDRDLSFNITGYEITQSGFERLQQKQQNKLPLVDEETTELLKSLVGIRFNQKDLFSNQLIETIGEAKTNQYQSNILRFSRIAQHLDVVMNCFQIIDIIKCLQFLSGMENATCSNTVGASQVGLEDVLAHFQKIAFLPIDK